MSDDNIKSITIEGKVHKDKINQVKNPIRIDAVKLDLGKIYYTYKKQIEIINQLYLNEEFEGGRHEARVVKLDSKIDP